VSHPLHENMRHDGGVTPVSIYLLDCVQSLWNVCRLKGLPSDAASTQILESLFHRSSDRIIEAIKQCAKLCDVYFTSHPTGSAHFPQYICDACLTRLHLVRLLTATKWQEKFSAAAAHLDTLKGDLRGAFLILGQHETQATVDASLARPTGSVVLDVSAAVNSPTVQMVEASAAFSVMKDEVSNFMQKSKVIMDALDELAKVHPFISGTPAFIFHLLNAYRA
jgi:hypothetical protein